MTPSKYHGTPLNLPPAALRLSQEGERISVYDPLRRRAVALTPEEWVRQHFVHYLIHHKAYPQGRMGNEISLHVGTLRKRCDTVVYDAWARPLLIIEYKASSVPITQRVFDQIWRYNLPLHVPYLMVSNGLQHFCCEINYAQQTYRLLSQIPPYDELLAPALPH